MQIAASRRYAVRLQESVVLILEAAELLSTAPGKDAEERASLVYRIREIERRDRDLAHSLTNDLNHAPLEPPDIKLLGDLIRDLSGILRSIAAASSKFALYQIPEPLPSNRPYRATNAEILGLRADPASCPYSRTLGTRHVARPLRAPAGIDSRSAGPTRP